MSRRVNTMSLSPSLKVESVDKQRIGLYLDGELAERIKNYVWHTPGQSLARFGEEALAKAIDEVEAVNGGPYPPRTGQLTPGRKFS